MKQGTANHTDSERKREPIVHKVSPAAVNQLGNHLGNYAASAKLYQGRGFEAPKASSCSSNCGSQGKHR